MTADEIRKHADQVSELETDFQSTQALWEIAAQLAEHNALLREVIRKDAWGESNVYVGGSLSTSVPES